MRTLTTIKVIVLCAIGLAAAAFGFYVGQTDDAPGAALLGLIIMTAMFVLAARIVRRRNKGSEVV